MVKTFNVRINLFILHCNFLYVSNNKGVPPAYDGDGGHIENDAGKFLVFLPTYPMRPQNIVLSLTDEQILSNFSTTPWTERGRFVKDIRSVFELARNDHRLRGLYRQSTNLIRMWTHIGAVENNEQQWQLELDSIVSA